MNVHVSVESDEEGVAVLDRIRIWMPVLLALTVTAHRVAGYGLELPSLVAADGYTPAVEGWFDNVKPLTERQKELIADGVDATSRPVRSLMLCSMALVSPSVADIRRKVAWGRVRSGICQATPRSRSP